MSTPHNSAEKGDFAKTVLMPGDPLRAKYIAENFLKDAKLVNNVRGVQGYTGLYKNTPVSVMKWTICFVRFLSHYSLQEGCENERFHPVTSEFLNNCETLKW